MLTHGTWRTVPISCSICLRDISRYRQRSQCMNCLNDQLCHRCMINGWCKGCYCSKKIMCAFCNVIVKKKKQIKQCIGCSISFCDKCGIRSLCKDCFIDKESESLVNIISKIRKDISISSISVIVDYCIGYIVPCCNQQREEKCDTMIVFRNRFEFLKCPETIYKYTPKHNNADSVNIYDTDLRIFCKECTAHKMEVCLNNFGGDCGRFEICGDTKYKNICGDHEFCRNCNQRELKQEYPRPNIHKPMRRWVYYTAAATTINKCLMCDEKFCTECIKYNKLFCKKCAEDYNQRIMENEANMRKALEIMKQKQLSYGENYMYDEHMHPMCYLDNRSTAKVHLYNAFPAQNSNTDIMDNRKVQLGEETGAVYDVVNNEKRRGTDQYKQECIARFKIGRAPIIATK